MMANILDWTVAKIVKADRYRAAALQERFIREAEQDINANLPSRNVPQAYRQLADRLATNADWTMMP